MSLQKKTQLTAVVVQQPRTAKAKATTAAPLPDWSHECPDNVAAVVTGDILTLTVDLSRSLFKSSTGKSVIVGTTRGFLEVPVHPGVSLSLNVSRRQR